MRISQIYPGIEGEGVFIGSPTIFVRFQKCSIGCKNCDSKETWNFRGGKEMPVEEIIKEVKKYKNIKRVSLTGGNVLEQNRDELIELLRELYILYEINIELANVNDFKNINVFDNGFLEFWNTLSIDIKSPSTGKFEESIISFKKDYIK